VEREGRPQFRIATAQGTWYYDRAGGGFSGLVDRDGNDWIAFHVNPLIEFPAAAAAGYRGIPNAVSNGPDEGAGHPGFDQCLSVLASGDTIRTTTKSEKWSWTWKFDEQRAMFSMDRADPDTKWWFLYEGPVAGTFAPSRKVWGTDKGGPRSDVPGITDQLFDTWRWVYFADRDIPRSLLILQHESDELSDTLWYLGSSNRGSSLSPDGMVVFGFGRGPRTTPLLQGAGHRFTVALIESAASSPEDHRRIAEQVEELSR
jgi:hypothetical protein